MKNIIIRWKTWSILLFSICLMQSGLAQTVAQSQQMADKYFELGQYEQALKTYLRVLYFSDTNNWEIYRKMARCSEFSGQPQKAYEYLNLAYFNAPGDSTKNELSFEKVAVHLKYQEFSHAQKELLDMEPASGYFQQKQYFYFGIAYFGNHEFEESHRNFAALFDSNDLHYLSQLEALFEENEKIERINPKTAQIMSLIIPGSGQIYAGDIKSGINSFLLNGTLMYLFMLTADYTTFLDASIIVYPWFFRYYIGGFKNAGTIAENKKAEKRSMVYQEIIRLILHKETEREK